jgi:hypothetical protein
MKRILGSWLLVALLLSGCSDANDQFIQGSWFFRDPHLKEVTGETYLEITWTFDRGTFEFYACCFNDEQHLAGRYRIVESNDDHLVLELFNLRGGEQTGRLEIGLRIDREQDALTIQGGGPYTRTLFKARSSGHGRTGHRQ